MKSVIEVNAEKSFAGPGEWAYDAEACVKAPEGDTVYVHVNMYDMFRHYVVSKVSMMEDIVDDSEFIEQYERMSDAKESKYYKVFDALNKVITMMTKDIE